LKTSATLVPGLRTLAAKTADGNICVALVNDSDALRQIQVTVPGGLPPRAAWKRYNYFPADHPVDHNGFPVPKEVLPNNTLATGLLIDLPARSLVLFTTLP